jgi:hypothetical protein
MKRCNKCKNISKDDKEERGMIPPHPYDKEKQLITDD